MGTLFLHTDFPSLEATCPQAENLDNIVGTDEDISMKQQMQVGVAIGSEFDELLDIAVP
jgi:hypothetical protein